MMILTLLLGWTLYVYGRRIGGTAGGLLCLAAYVTTPTFLVFGPLVLTDLPATLFFLVALWQLGEIWANPTRRNEWRFGVAFGAALLAKFTGVLMIPIILALFVQTRYWPTSGEPRDKEGRREWRRARWGCVLRGVTWAAAVVYVVYLAFSWNQPDDAMNRVGSGSWAWVIRRPLMPVWLYLRGFLAMLLSGSRPTYLFGHTFAHGVPFYFPVVFALKSTLGFLLLLLLAAAAGFAHRGSGAVIPEAVWPHWRVLLVGFLAMLTVCLLSRLDISIRHFMTPIVILILMLAPLPRMIEALPGRRIWRTAVVVFAAISFVPAFASYPYYFSFANTLGFGRPSYYLFNGSNVTWNEGLLEVGRFAREHGLNAIEVDYLSVADPTLVVPEIRLWDCQSPTEQDAGHWVVVTGSSIREDHNCGYLEQYPHESLAGGGFYAFQMPAAIPPAGAPGGPPAVSQRRPIFGLPVDIRAWMLNVEQHPERLEPEMKELGKQFQPKKQ